MFDGRVLARYLSTSTVEEEGRVKRHRERELIHIVVRDLAGLDQHAQFVGEWTVLRR